MYRHLTIIQGSFNNNYIDSYINSKSCENSTRSFYLMNSLRDNFSHTYAQLNWKVCKSLIRLSNWNKDYVTCSNAVVDLCTSFSVMYCNRPIEIKIWLNRIELKITVNRIRIFTSLNYDLINTLSNGHWKEADTKPSHSIEMMDLLILFEYRGSFKAGVATHTIMAIYWSNRSAVDEHYHAHTATKQWHDALVIMAVKPSISNGQRSPITMTS